VKEVLGVLAAIFGALALLILGMCVYMRLRLGFWPWEDWQ